MWATKQYVWATRFQFLGAQVATKALKPVCSTAYNNQQGYYSPGKYANFITQ